MFDALLNYCDYI